jgi:hypothetical protein
MTLYALILFVHIASAFFLFAGLTLQWMAFSVLRRGAGAAHTCQWVRLAAFSARLYGPSIGLVILSGGYLGSALKAWNQAWLPGSFLALLVIGAIGVAISEPRVRALQKRMAANGAEPPGEVMERLQDPVLLASVRVRMALILGVLFLMVSKVNLVPTIVVLLLSLIAGLVIAAFSWRPARKAASMV